MKSSPRCQPSLSLVDSVLRRPHQLEPRLDPLNRLEPERLDGLIEAHGLPLHIYFATRVAENAARFRAVTRMLYPGTVSCFAVKSNPCRGAVRLAERLGLGADVVSEFELQAALEEGIPASRIVCHGNAKSNRYIDLIAASGVLTSVGSRWELGELSAAASRAGRPVPVLLRFSGMPLEGFTAADQSTASPWTKFGFPYDTAADVFRAALKARGVEPVGLSAHLGTQICDAAGYELLLEHLLALGKAALDAGLALEHLNIGGGFPVNYLSQDDWDAFKERLWSQIRGKLQPADWVTWDGIPMGFGGVGIAGGGRRKPSQRPPVWRGKGYWSPYPGARMLKRILSHPDSEGASVAERLRSLGEPILIIEPGRALFGTAGVTVAAVAGVKQVQGNNLVSLDLGVVNHGTALITPDIYPVEVFPPHPDDKPFPAFLAGRLCFTGDMVSKVKVTLNREPTRGELVVIHHTGAYCADHFASNSCGFPRPAKVAVMEDGAVQVWRRGEGFGDIFGDLKV